MNEATIKELLSRLFNMQYESKGYSIGNITLPVISKENQRDVENVVRQWALEFHDNRTGTLEAKVFVYEQIIKNSNFAPMIQNGNNTRGGNIHDNPELLED